MEIEEGYQESQVQVSCRDSGRMSPNPIPKSAKGSFANGLLQPHFLLTRHPNLGLHLLPIQNSTFIIPSPRVHCFHSHGICSSSMGLMGLYSKLDTRACNTSTCDQAMTICTWSFLQSRNLSPLYVQEGQLISDVVFLVQACSAAGQLSRGKVILWC